MAIKFTLIATRKITDSCHVNSFGWLHRHILCTSDQCQCYNTNAPKHAQACHCKSNGDLDGDKGKKNHWAGSSTVTVLCAPEQSVHSHIPRQHKRLPWYDGDMWWGHYLYPRLFTKFCCYSICKLELHFVGQSGWVTCISVIAWLHWIYVTTIDNPTPIIVILIIYIISYY